MEFRETNKEFRENSAKINDFIFAKFKIISSKFRVSRNFENAVSQPPYIHQSQEDQIPKLATKIQYTIDS